MIVGYQGYCYQRDRITNLTETSIGGQRLCFVFEISRVRISARSLGVLLFCCDSRTLPFCLIHRLLTILCSKHANPRSLMNVKYPTNIELV
jgi:hypothetical protein